jgi:hypothetical protein
MPYHLLLRSDLARRKTHPLRSAPDEMPGRNANESSEAGEGYERVQRDAVGDVVQIDEAGVAVRIQREYPRSPDVKSSEREERIPQGARSAERGPGNRFPIRRCLRAVALESFSPPVEP